MGFINTCRLSLKYLKPSTTSYSDSNNNHPDNQKQTTSNLLKEPFSVRHAIALDPNTGSGELFTLSKDKDYNIRATVAMNKSTGQWILDILAKDKDWRVRWEVAFRSSNPNTLDLLSRDKHYKVRALVAGNDDAYWATIENLAKDENQEVRETALKRYCRRGLLY